MAEVLQTLKDIHCGHKALETLVLGANLEQQVKPNFSKRLV